MFLEHFTLLYVEDDKDTQVAMKELLENEVRIFYQAYNGKEGLSLYEEKKPDIILTDINMPVMNGLDMASAIKDMNRTQPIVITSAFDEKNILFDALNIGIDGFVLKPVDMILLMEKLESIAVNLQDHIEAQQAREKRFLEKEKKLHDLAYYDALTAIPNRFLFRQKLTMAIEKSKLEKHTVALFFIDLDNFKTVNDTYGHKAGDAVLINSVNNITNAIRKSDIFARIGGDEFALIVENISSKDCLRGLAKKVIDAASIPTLFQNKKLQISCSIGIGLCINGEVDSEELIHHADLAMYQAKTNGRSDFAFWTPSLI